MHCTILFDILKTMKNKIISIYSVFITLIFIFSIAFFSFNLITENKNGKDRCATRFNSVVESMTKNPSNINAEKLFYEYNDFALINIYKNGKTISAYPKISNGQDDFNSSFVQTFSYSFSYGQDNYSIKAVMYTLRPAKIYASALISFSIILIATIFTILLIIFLTVKEKKQKDSSNNLENQDSVLQEKEQKDDTNKVELEPEKENFTDEQNDGEAQKDNFEFETGKENDNENDYLYEEIDFEAKNDAQNLQESNDESIYYEEPVFAESETNSNDNEPASNKDANKEQNESEKSELNTEANSVQQPTFQETLAKELVKSGSTEQDLALILIKIPELDEQLYERISSELVQNFMIKSNLIFKKEADCIAIIKNEMEINSAEEFAEKIRNQILTFEGVSNCFIGISCRAVRLVNAERIILESEQALEHAQQEKDSPIIGFHVDIEKYMQYIKENANEA